MATDAQAVLQTKIVTIEVQAVLFDMDGVLISSAGSATKCWRIWAKHYNLPDADTFEYPHGVRAREAIRQLLPHVNEDEALRTIEDIEIDDVAGIRVLPGVEALLERLPRARWTIVTSCTRRLMNARLAESKLPLPDQLLTADDVDRGKPAPDPYIAGAKMLGFTAPECLVVEDALSGIEAGLAAGSRVLAVMGTHPVEELHRATWIAPSLEGVEVAVTERGLTLRVPVLP